MTKRAAEPNAFGELVTGRRQWQLATFRGRVPVRVWTARGSFAWACQRAASALVRESACTRVEVVEVTGKGNVLLAVVRVQVESAWQFRGGL